MVKANGISIPLQNQLNISTLNQNKFSWLFQLNRKDKKSLKILKSIKFYFTDSLNRRFKRWQSKERATQTNFIESFRKIYKT